MNRRDALTTMSMAGGASLIPSAESVAGALTPGASASFEQAVRGTAPVRIRDIKTILTAPNRIRLVVVKVETVNPIRSFKGRGTDFFLRDLVPRPARVVCASAGNFGQGLAYAARSHGVACEVFAAASANPLKVERMRAFGAVVRLAGPDFDDAKAHAKNPIRLFVCHVWQQDDDYHRIFEYLESASNFFYRNTSTPDQRPAGDKEVQRDDLRRQITDAEVVLMPASLYRKHLDWAEFQLHCAKAFDKPVVVLEPFGSHDTIAPAVLEMGDEVVPWDQRQLVDAIKRQARHEETTRFDVIEFKLD